MQRQAPLPAHQDIPSIPLSDETPPVQILRGPDVAINPSLSKRWRSNTLHHGTPVPSRGPETLIPPSLSKRWRSDVIQPEIPVPRRSRSGTLHPENFVSKRWKAGALYPENPVQNTVPRRWRASVLRALRQMDSRDIPAKRARLASSQEHPRLAPSQVTTTNLSRSNKWSLGADGNGPLFEEIPRNWRHTVFLTGRAARKEVQFASESSENQRLLLAAMACEWKKWKEHKATLPLTQGELDKLKSRFPNLKIVGTRWVLTPKEPDFKARLVVQRLPGRSDNDACGLSHRQS